MKTRVFILILMSFLFLGCEDKQSVRKFSFQKYQMDTVFEITVYSPYDQASTRKKVDAAFDRIAGLEKRYSSWTPGTLIWTLNHDFEAELGEQDYYILKTSQDIGALTGGRFDISVLPLMGVWGFRDKKYRIPLEEEIAQARKKVNIKENLELTPKKAVVKNKAMLDLGGILKGYAVDVAVDELRAQGIKIGIVNAGGNLMAFGKKPGGKPWIIGIRHPREEGTLFATYELPADRAIATSGDYERFFFLDGVRYHHIMDPVTGRPVSNTLVSVSVIHDSTLMTDALATALFVMGIGEGLAFAEEHKIPVYLMYEQDGRIFTTNSSQWDLKKTHF